MTWEFYKIICGVTSSYETSSVKPSYKNVAFIIKDKKYHIHGYTTTNLQQKK